MKKNFWQSWNLKGLELGEFGSATWKVPVKKITSRKGKKRLNKENPQKNWKWKKNLLAAMSLKGPEVSLDAAHRDPGSSSTYVTWFEKKGPRPFFYLRTKVSRPFSQIILFLFSNLKHEGHTEWTYWNRVSSHLDSLLGRLHGKLWFLSPSIATSEFGNWLFTRRSIVTQCKK